MFKFKDQEISDMDMVNVTEVPSNFLPYPDDLSIRYKTYRWGEVKQISKEKYEEKTLIPYISRGIEVSSKQEPDFTIEKLTLSDFLYISLLRKLSTFGTEKFQIVIECENCKEHLTKEIVWNALEFEELDIPKLPVIVKLSEGTLLKFNPITVGEYVELVDEDKGADEVRAIWRSLVNKDVVPYEKIYNMSLQDGQIMDEVNDILYHGLKEVDIKCTKEACKTLNRVSVDGKETLLRPYFPANKIKEDRIRFGV